MAKSSTHSVVLDTSIIAKSILEPPKYLSPKIYKRGVETRKKIHIVLGIPDAQNYVIYFSSSRHR